MSDAVELLLGSDFHLGEDIEAFEAGLADAVVPIFCGDLINRPRDDADAFRTITARWAARNADLVIVPGNHDPEDTGPWEGAQVHERQGLTILALPFTPLMAQIPTWTHEMSEARIEAAVAPFRGGRYDVVASHAPPRGACDRVFWGRAIGSTALRDLARTLDFGLWVCGHVHEEGGRETRLDDRPVLNVARQVVRRRVVPAAAASSGNTPR